jgi:hypothetical protein
LPKAVRFSPVTNTYRVTAAIVGVFVSFIIVVFNVFLVELIYLVLLFDTTILCF